MDQALLTVDRSQIPPADRRAPPAIDRIPIGRRPLIVVRLATSAGCMFLMSWTAAFGGLLGVTIVYGVGVAVTPAMSAYITDLTQRARYGAAHGLFGTIYDIGDALGPICGGLVVARAGYAAAFHLAGVMALAIACVVGYAARD